MTDSQHNDDTFDLLCGICSLILCGSGQCMKGSWGRGAAFFFGAIICWCVLLGWVVHIFAAVDAYKLGRSA